MDILFDCAGFEKTLKTVLWPQIAMLDHHTPGGSPYIARTPAIRSEGNGKKNQNNQREQQA
jgi:hypothetical protein